MRASTGLATPWNPSAASGTYANIYVWTLAVSGTTVYAGGEFTSIGGQSRSGIAVLDTGTGLATAWNPTAGGTYPSVLSLAVSGATVYAGGAFTSIGGQSKSGFAAIGPADDTAPTVQVLWPNGHSPMRIGSQRQLSWSATDNIAVQSVDLYLSRTGPMGSWELLAAGAPNTGSYLWTVTGPEVTGNNAYLLVNARDYGGNIGTDISNTGFIASDTASANVEPNAGVTAFALGAPAPNPAAGRSLLTFAIPTSTHVHLSLLDVQGREVAVLADGMREPGRYTAALEAGDLRAGIYFARMQAGSTKLTRRVVVLQ